MNKSAILKELNAIFIDIFETEELVIDMHTAAKDVDDWDSLNHIQLVVAIEKHFKIRFTSREIQSWNNVGDIINSVESKITV
jgi:acyl carrier protein